VVIILTGVRLAVAVTAVAVAVAEEESVVVELH
jgi:hypothetical protein